MTPTASPAFTRQLWNKVPEVTIFFWIIKVLATTVGETAGDLLSTRLGLGLTNTLIVMSVVTIAVLVWQVMTKRYAPAPYWLSVVLISVVGTLITDYLHDNLGISFEVTTSVFTVILAAVFAIWYAFEHTLSIHSIITTRRELFYWSAILFTFALGTSAGDQAAESLNFGYGPSAIIFAQAIAAVTAVFYILKSVSRLQPHSPASIWCFWIAYILTRPLGASVGDYLAKPHIAGGWGLGTLYTSELFLVLISALVVFLTATRIDRQEAADPQAA